MITSLSASAGLMVTGGSSNLYVNMQQPSAGLVRYNGNSQRMEVYDGNVWLPLGNHPNLQLTPQVQEILNWAEKKMNEEQDLERRMQDHLGLRDAYEKFKVIDTLTSDKITQGAYRRA